VVVVGTCPQTTAGLGGGTGLVGRVATWGAGSWTGEGMGRLALCPRLSTTRRTHTPPSLRPTGKAGLHPEVAIRSDLRIRGAEKDEASRLEEPPDGEDPWAAHGMNHPVAPRTALAAHPLRRFLPLSAATGAPLLSPVRRPIFRHLLRAPRVLPPPTTPQPTPSREPRPELATISAKTTQILRFARLAKDKPTKRRPRGPREPQTWRRSE
jgi:hypothetical protein